MVPAAGALTDISIYKSSLLILLYEIANLFLPLL